MCAKRRIRKEIENMRLINADRLIGRFKELKGSDSLANMFITDVIGQIKAQPTAYDLDKVIEDLDKFAHSDICISCPKCRYVDEDNINCENCGALGALEIVKRGGLS